jgi:hypothetical protein
MPSSVTVDHLGAANDGPIPTLIVVFAVLEPLQDQLVESELQIEFFVARTSSST